MKKGTRKQNRRVAQVINIRIVMFRTAAVSVILSLLVGIGYSLEPEEILVVANKDIPASVRVAEYYSAKRSIPKDNLLYLSLGKDRSETISREDYETMLAEPVRYQLTKNFLPGEIRTLVTTYGIPVKVKGRGQLKGKEDELKKLRISKEKLQSSLSKLEADDSTDAGKHKQNKIELTKVESKIDRILGRETDASVDSELSIVLYGDYELYRWQRNEFRRGMPSLVFNTIMVSRLDGPSEQICKGLIDKSIAAEKKQLKAEACIDSRGLERSRKLYSLGYYDQSLRDLAMLIKFNTDLTVKHEQTKKLFGAGSCPNTAIYCGWYSLGKYVDAFDFVEGAIGYHISSLEAVNLRDANSSQWCPAMLIDGITATIGAVAEPYLHSFPEPDVFFGKLLNGDCLVEAFYYSKPFNSWRLVLIGDALYRPFKNTR